MSALLLLFVVAIANVFVLAMQSRNINAGQYQFAAMGSFGIGMSQAFIWKAITTTGWLDALIYSAGGAIGCVSAMYVHRRFIGERKPRG